MEQTNGISRADVFNVVDPITVVVHSNLHTHYPDAFVY